MSATKFTRTAKAAQADRLSRWDLIAAIAEDAVDAGLPISGVESVLAAKAAMAEGGDEYSDKTVKAFACVAKFDYESTAAQRKVWRQYGPSIVRLPANAGWSQERAAEVLGGQRLSFRDVAAMVRAASPRASAAPPLDQRWAQWVHHMNALLMEGARLADESEAPDVTLGGHSAMGLAIYHNLIEREFDREVRRLLSEATT